MTQKPLLQIDLQSVIDARVDDSKRKYIPRWAVRMLEKVIHQDDLNALLRTAYPAEGPDFSDSILKQLGITLEIEHQERIPSSDKKLIFVSNHPLGGLDGIALVKVLGNIFGPDNVMVLVNDLLMYVSPLCDMFLPINKYGRQARGSAAMINEVYSSDKQLLVFPAGLVSRKSKDGQICDLEWRKAFVVKALEYQRTVVPIYFDALNTPFFYRLADLRKRLGIKVNVEQIFLPREIFKTRGRTFRIVFGDPITPEELSSLGRRHSDIAQAVRKRVYEVNG